MTQKLAIGTQLGESRIDMNELWTLLFTFFRIGGLTFGGGYAMLPILQKEVVERYGWISSDELLNYYAVGQCIPGIIAVNTAIFVGHKRRGLAGAVFAMIGVVLPSLIVITVIAAFLQNFTQILYVQQAFSGIRVAVCALILDTVLKLCKKNVKSFWDISIFCVAFLATVLFAFSPIYLVIIAATVGIVRGKMKKDGVK